MNIRIALAGNPNSGKTTLFNALTGSNQYVGNWPGVTVEKKEGFLKSDENIIVTDLPGIYSLSPYTLEEVVARDYLTLDKPDVIINLVDATNIERNLYLTTQLTELGIPVVIALNMIDIFNKSGDTIKVEAIEKAFGCPVVLVSALKNTGLDMLMDKASKLARENKRQAPSFRFSKQVENAISNIRTIIKPKTDEISSRWYSIKLFEKDIKVQNKLQLTDSEKSFISRIIDDIENSHDDDSESIITSERYDYIEEIVNRYVKKVGKFNISNRIDKVLTNRFLAIPIFAILMLLVYYIAVTVVGGVATDFVVDTVFGVWISKPLESLLIAINTAPWLNGLILDGIVVGVGSVISFVPQMVVLFLMLCILEDCGYMSRIAFIMDKIFHYFGLSGKSFIPMLIGTGCSVPGIMASRTIENESDRKMTIITTSFIPCGAKMPVIALFAAAFFGGAWWVAPLAYFIGVLSVIVSGVLLKKTSLFSNEETPFVMELPNYHIPSASNVLRGTWDRSWSFIKKAGTIILLASIVVWFLSNYGFSGGRISRAHDMNGSILAIIGGAIAPIFAPIGFGNWQATVSTLLGLVAKEEIVGAFSVLYGNDITSYFTTYSAFSFLLFNLLCAPCFAAMGAIRREMNDAKWTIFAISYQTVFAYFVSMIYYQFSLVFAGNPFGIFTAISVLILGLFVYLIFRKSIDKKRNLMYHKL